MDWIIANHCNDQPVAGFSGQPNLSTSRFRGVVQISRFWFTAVERKPPVREGRFFGPASARTSWLSPLGGSAGGSAYSTQPSLRYGYAWRTFAWEDKFKRLLLRSEFKGTKAAEPQGALVYAVPVVSNGVLHVASLGATGSQMCALDPATGSILWQFAAGGSVGAHPAIAAAP